ncbi:MAG: SH3 domain-containing protein [Pseudomonadota bacterium]
MSAIRAIAALWRRAIGLLLVSAVLLQACATLPTDEAGDTCAPLRQPLKQIVQQYNERILRDTLTGAALGALTGLTLAAIVGGDLAVGAAVGGVAGGIAGAANAYYTNKQQKFTNNADLRRAIASDITQSTGNVREVTAATTRLNQCRLGQITDLRGRIEAGANGPAERQTLADIRRRIEQDQKLIAEVVGDVGTGNQVYTKAFAQSREIEEGRVARRAERYEPRLTQPTITRAGKPRSFAYARKGVNVRSGPGRNHGRIGSLVSGQRIGVVSGALGSGWVEVAYGGRQGFVAGSFLGSSPPASASTQTAKAPPAAELPVVRVNSAPQGSNEMDTLLIAAKDMEAGSEAQADTLFAEMDSVGALLE